MFRSKSKEFYCFHQASHLIPLRVIFSISLIYLFCIAFGEYTNLRVRSLQVLIDLLSERENSRQSIIL